MLQLHCHKAASKRAQDLVVAIRQRLYPETWHLEARPELLDPSLEVFDGFAVLNCPA